MAMPDPVQLFMKLRILSDMRKLVFFAMAVVAICFMTACQREPQSEIPENPVRTITVHATQAETKTTFDGTVNGIVYYKWEQGDRLRLFELTEGYDCLAADSEPLTSSSSSVQFSVTFNENPKGNDLKYVGVYLPGDPDYDARAQRYYTWFPEWGAEPTLYPWVVLSTIPFIQYPTASCFDPNADLLVSKVAVADSERPGNIDLAFARVGSIAKITLTNLPQGEDVVRVSFSHGESWISSGFVFYQPDSEKIGVDPFSIKSGESSFLTYFDVEPRSLVVDTDGKAVIWLRVLSGTLSDFFSIEVETVNRKEEHSYFEKYVDLTSFTPAKSIKFEEGDITAFSVAMERSSLIRFTNETLELFPELNSSNPVIRIPRDYYMFRSSELKVGIECLGNSWSAELDGMNEGEWLSLYQYSSQTDCVFLEKKDAYWFTTDTHTATLKIYCDNELELEIPIVEVGDYYSNLGLPFSVTLKKGNQVISNNCHVNLKSGEPITFTVSLSDIPSWLESAKWESYWYMWNQNWSDDDEYIPSPNLPIDEEYYYSLYNYGSLNNTEYTSEITITPGEYGDDVLCFEHYIYLSNPISVWLVGVWTYVNCNVTVGSGVFIDDRFSGQSGSAGNPQNPGDFNGGSYDL